MYENGNSSPVLNGGVENHLRKSVFVILQALFADQQDVYMLELGKNSDKSPFSVICSSRSDMFCSLPVAEMLCMKIKKETFPLCEGEIFLCDYLGLFFLM